VTAQEFLSRLQRVKKQAGDKGWLASCPSHGEDKDPSLSVRQADGKILLNCFAGCSADAILSAMNLDASDLFDKADDPPKRTIKAEYSYQDEDGKLLFQAIRFNPKGFSQRRPDGKNWIWNLQGVRRVVYRLPELLGQKSILFVEGEKDADAAWKLGIPATTSPMGAGNWDAAYASQIHKQGVKRVAVIPDNDASGKAHAGAVAASLHALSVDVLMVTLPGVPDKGDLSDYLGAGRTKEELLGLIKATPLWDPSQLPTVVDTPVLPRTFTALGEQKYSLAIQPEGIVLEVNRLRRSSQELVGELLVRVNGYFPNAKTYGEGILQVGDMNFSSTQARTTRAKLLADRAGNKDVDWYGFLEEFVTTVIATERRGKPAEILADVEEEDESSESFTVEGFPLLSQLPQIVFGDSSSGKSYFAMWLAGKLAEQGVNVLYIDWEFSKNEHKKRLASLFPFMPRNLFYVRCEHSLKQEVDHIADLVQKHKIGFGILDSIGFAVDGPAESQEGAAGYFRYLRQLRIGSLSIAHIPKQSDDKREATIFGSAFFKAGARSAWFIDRAKENPQGEIRFGLYHRKNNVGALLQPKGFKLIFRGERTLVESINLKEVDELAAGYPLLDRMKEILIPAPLTMKQLAEELDVTVPAVKTVLARHRSQFIKIGNKVSVGASGEPDNAAEF